MNNKCRISGGKLKIFLDLGDQYISTFVPKKDLDLIDKSPLKLAYNSKSKVVQLYDTYDQKKMYSKYWYRSGINESMRKSLAQIVESAYKYIELNKDDIALDIASNDGTLLSYLPNHINKIGVDPSDVAKKSNLYKKKNYHLINNFFDKKDFLEFTNKKKAKLITCIAMFYDLANPIRFLKHVKDSLDDQGIFIVQLSYTPLMLKTNEFGFISHEHICYYTLNNLLKLFSNQGLEIFDIDLNEVNGASIRCYVKKTSKILIKVHKNLYDIGSFKINSILRNEYIEKFHTLKPYLKFRNNINSLKFKTIKWLKEQKVKNKLVIGYGASTKGNVLLQFYQINSDLIPYIAERSDEKVGLFTPGSGIEIISEKRMRKMKPDYLFILPWFFYQVFLKREKKLRASGTKFFLPQPEIKIV